MLLSLVWLLNFLLKWIHCFPSGWTLCCNCMILRKDQPDQLLSDSPKPDYSSAGSSILYLYYVSLCVSFAVFLPIEIPDSIFSMLPSSSSWDHATWCAWWNWKQWWRYGSYNIIMVCHCFWSSDTNAVDKVSRKSKLYDESLEMSARFEVSCYLYCLSSW